MECDVGKFQIPLNDVAFDYWMIVTILRVRGARPARDLQAIISRRR